MTAIVETLAGPLDTVKLGTTLMHEHLVVLTPEIQWSYDNYNGWDEQVVIPRVRDAMRQIKEAGVDTIVDLTVVGLGRNIRVMQEAVRDTGLQVIAATGMYIFGSLPWLFRYGKGYGAPEPRPGEPDGLLDVLFLADIREGMQGTGVKAAILKCATDSEGLTPHVERVLRSCARVSRETGIPISTHTHMVARGGIEQQQIFRDEGVDLGRVIIGHSGDHTDLDYLEKLIDGGSLLGMDRFGLVVPPPLEQRCDVIATLCARGYADRMVLSHDANAFLDWFPQEPNVWNASIVDRFLYVPKVVVPALKERGVTQSQIDQMLIHTPRRFFEGK